MNTVELLESAKVYFPDLTDKTLRDWVKDGFLQKPERVGMGAEGGTPNEWASDSVARIQIIKSVTNKRVDKTRARRALIAKGYFIGVAGLRAELDRIIEEIHEYALHPKRYEENCKNTCECKDKRKCKCNDVIRKNNGVMRFESSIFGDGLFGGDMVSIIGTALVMPTFIFNEVIDRRREEETSAHPCIFSFVVVSYHCTRRRQLGLILKARPCSVDQALLLIPPRQHRH